MIDIYLLDVNISIDFTLYNKLINSISKEKRKRINKYKHNKDKLKSLLADILLRTQLCKNNNCKFKDLEFEHNAYGKPKLIGDSNIYFNISHSGDYVVVGISDREIGIDIERINGKETKLLDLAKLAYSKEEYNWILKNKYTLIKKNFYKIWTLKESYVKFIGKGLSIPLDSFKFQKYKGNIYLNKNGLLIKHIQFKNYNLHDKYILSICYENNINNNEIKIIYQNFNELKNDTLHFLL